MELHFDEHGSLTGRDRFLDEAAGVENLFVLSHGWNTSENSANRLYDAMFPMIRQAAGAAGLNGIGFAGIIWPALWFPPTPAQAPSAGQAIQADDDPGRSAASGTGALSGAEITGHLESGFPEDRRATLREIGRLVDDGMAAAGTMSEDDKRAHVGRIHELIGSLVPVGGEREDNGELALLTSDDPVVDYGRTAEVFNTVPAAAPLGAGDWFRKALTGVKDGLRVLSYTTMKARAGEIGRTGLGPLLRDLHHRSPATRVHLIGHSFGARLVSFALAGVGSPDDSPIASLVLLQAAFSTWSFSHPQDNPFQREGALRNVADRVHGPLVATFSPFDYAVGVWYPKASFVARQDQSASGAPRWGGLGAHGFQAVHRLEDRTMTANGADYGFEPGVFYRVDAAGVINTVENSFSGAHSDIRKPPVAELIAAAAVAK